MFNCSWILNSVYKQVNRAKQKSRGCKETENIFFIKRFGHFSHHYSTHLEYNFFLLVEVIH